MLFDRLSAAAVKRRLHTKRLGQYILYFDTLPSTNDTAKEQVHHLPHGALIIAGRQTAGKGRKGRSFYSNEKNGVYCSIVLKGPFAPEDMGQLTTKAAVAVANAIEHCCPVTTQIKWVNDLLINGKKVCGILTEGTFDPEKGHIPYAVVGIGVNVRTKRFPKELEPIATCLSKESGVVPKRAVLIATLLEQLETAFDADFSDILQQSRDRSAVLGKPVTVIQGNNTVHGTAVAIGKEGELVVDTDQGTLTFSSGEVTVRI